MIDAQVPCRRQSMNMKRKIRKEANVLTGRLPLS